MKKLLLLAAAFAFLSLAQEPGLFPWWDSRVVRDLNLSEDQRNQIQAIGREFRDRLTDQRAVVKKAEGALQDAMNGDPVDEAKAGAATESLIAARGELSRTFFRMGLQMRKVLTAQQWQELQSRRRPMRRGDWGGHRREHRRPPGRPSSPPSESPAPGP
jgi:Spy/CpxP family protein refolding chaperone